MDVSLAFAVEGLIEDTMSLFNDGSLQCLLTLLPESEAKLAAIVNSLRRRSTFKLDFSFYLSSSNVCLRRITPAL